MRQPSAHPEVQALQRRLREEIGDEDITVFRLYPPMIVSAPNVHEARLLQVLGKRVRHVEKVSNGVPAGHRVWIELYDDMETLVREVADEP